MYNFSLCVAEKEIGTVDGNYGSAASASLRKLVFLQLSPFWSSSPMLAAGRSTLPGAAEDSASASIWAPLGPAWHSAKATLRGPSPCWS
ncbi:hypothetical protein BHE74_00051307 [Ensete ventricosum]|nr:hypothetical protein BHE74_00051307 [Ensete ventricosum]RZR97360.1 hypothetical protein BHM03_00026513 [Ensete ventricosum]